MVEQMIYFRADANKNIGMGHLMRCLSIADAAKGRGQKAVFLLADDSMTDLVAERGFDTIVLGTDYRSMDEELSSWPSPHADYIIVDSYSVTAGYLERLKKLGRVIYIDDRAAFDYPVDILVNYNAFAHSLDYEELYGGQPPRLILGPQYAPLRSMFRGLDRRSQKRNVEDVLISTGGSDPLHLALSIAEEKPDSFIYHILIGALNSDKAALEHLAAGSKHIVLHENVSDMKSLICSCDIAVSAAGSTLYEICACGVPLITYSLADNQLPGAEAFENNGFAVNLGDMRLEKHPAKRILTAVEQFSREYDKRIEMGNRMQDTIDGNGAARLIDEIILH